MSSFSSLYADVQLCVLRFLPLSDLVAMVRSCKSFSTVASRLQSDAVDHQPHAANRINRCDPLLFPHPRSVLRHLITRLNFHGSSRDLLSLCAPHTLREICPGLRWLHLECHSDEAVTFEPELQQLPAHFWPSKLQALVFEWGDVYASGRITTLDDMADQLRSLCRVAALFPRLTHLTLDAMSNLPCAPEIMAAFNGQAAFPPFLAPLLNLPKMTHLRVALNDYQFGKATTSWLSDEDCSVLARLPKLRVFQLSECDCRWSAQGLLPFLLHSAEAAPLCARLTSLKLCQWGVKIIDDDAKDMFDQLMIACPRAAANSADDR